MLFSWLRSLGRRVQRAARSRDNFSPYRHRARLCVEALEDRTVPTTVQVINLNAAGAGSLAAAVAAVDASTDASNQIWFTPGLSGLISISSSLDLKDTSGQVPNKEIDIQGPGFSILGVKRDATQGNFRDFWVASGISSTISGLYIQNGNTTGLDPHRGGDGGGILNEGRLTLINVVLADNNSANNGGAIANYGTLTTDTVVVTENTAQRSGGGLYNAGSATFQNADEFSYNGAVGTGGSGIYNAANATLSLSGTNIHDNGSPAGGSPGAGIFNDGTLTMNGGQIQNNNTFGGLGGGLFSDGSANLSGVSITGNTASYGGGVYVASNTTTCTGCTITGNTATKYGSIGCYRFGVGTLTLTNCTIDGGTLGKDPRY